MPQRDRRLAHEPDEDALDRESDEHGSPHLMIAIGLPRQFARSGGDEASDGGDLDLSIKATEHALEALRALKRGDKKAANEHCAKALEIERQLDGGEDEDEDGK